MTKKSFKVIGEILEIGLIVFALSWFCQVYWLGFAKVEDNAMLPTLEYNDRVLINKYFNKNKDLARGDIVLISAADKQQKVLKRIIGLEGETIEIRNGFIYVNGEPLYEPYAYTPVTLQLLPIRIPPGHVFVLNDDRTKITDSRLMGNIPLTHLHGKAVLTYWPWLNIKLL
ncbi:MAG TPA: signal peptidase I [Peptococcaceae bacterium]|nr:signal peptidase I [Peptococcaceae bacterium]